MNMSMSLWISLGVAIALVLFYVLCMEVLARKSREIDSQVDYNRISPWRGDEDKS
jgi:low affinity Fe/Cu permease